MFFNLLRSYISFKGKLFLMLDYRTTITPCYTYGGAGLVVSVLDFRSGGRWFEPGLCCRVASLDKKLYSTLSPFTQVYKWVPAIIMLGGNLAMDSASHPGGIGMIIFSVASCYGNRS